MMMMKMMMREGEGEEKGGERERGVCVYDLPTYSIQTAREVRMD